MFNSQQEARQAGQQTLYDLARQCMWERRGDKYVFDKGLLNTIQAEEIDYAKARERMFHNAYPTVSVIKETFIPYQSNPTIEYYQAKIDSLDCCNTAQITVHQEKENNMYAKTTATIDTDSSLSYIQDRLYKIYKGHLSDMRKAFHMDDAGPRSVKELKAA